jgi:hypothetical protein
MVKKSSSPSDPPTGVTIMAESTSYDDVLAAINSANSGDVIGIPSGESTWATRLELGSKSITLRGNGLNNTVIKNGIGANFLIKISPTVPADNPYIEITGITFDGNSTGACLYIDAQDDNNAYTNFRIHHNKFMNTPNVSNAYMSISTKGNCFGLIDNNQFDYNYYDFKIYGNDQNSWDNYPGIENVGTANYLYIENNISTACRYFVLTSGEGARWVYRYNTTDISDVQAILDAHGNTQNDGVVAHEAYENTFSGGDKRLHDLRGGTGIIYNNSVNRLGAGGHGRIQIREEDGYYSGVYTYPAEDPVNNCYLWNNIDSYNGEPFSIFEYDIETYNLIAKNRDYWCDVTPYSYNDQTLVYDNPDSLFTSGLFADRPVSPTVDDCYWATDTKQLLRCENNGNWTFIYSPYTYPHLLIG